MTGDRAIRWATAAVVTAVAMFAAIVSYSHVYDLGHMHGQYGTAGRLLPLSVDGLILAASLVMLHDARKGRAARPLARWMLGAGVAATVAGNVAYGAAFGPVGAIVSAWPALAFIGSAELALGLVRRDVGGVVPTVAADAESAALAAYLASVAGGNPLSGRQLETRFGLTRAQVTKVRGDVNGSAHA